jgi:hypothetical protein
MRRKITMTKRIGIMLALASLLSLGSNVFAQNSNAGKKTKTTKTTTTSTSTTAHTKHKHHLNPFHKRHKKSRSTNSNSTMSNGNMSGNTNQ